MEIYEKFKKIATKRTKCTTAERELIVEYAAKHDLHLNTLCPDCYKDVAAELYGMYRPKPAEDDSKYVLRPGLDVRFNGLRVCETTLTDDMAERILRAGFPERFFIKLPTNGDNEQDEVR